MPRSPPVALSVVLQDRASSMPAVRQLPDRRRSRAPPSNSLDVTRCCSETREHLTSGSSGLDLVRHLGWRPPALESPHESRHDLEPSAEGTGSAASRSASRRRLLGGHPVPHLRSREDRARSQGRRQRPHSLGRGVRPPDGAVAQTVVWTDIATEDLDAVADFIARDSQFCCVHPRAPSLRSARRSHPAAAVT